MALNIQPKKVGLALGGGAARGFAHIGVLKVLAEENIGVDFVVGSSMGAVIGAFYCSGMGLRLMERLAVHTHRNHWVDLTFPRLGLISGEKLEQLLHILTRRAVFADLATPLAVVATDLSTGGKVVLTEGAVARAVRASAAIPGIFCPVEHQGKTLVDGCVVERVPAPTARELGAGVVIAVDVGVYLNAGKAQHIFDVVTQCFDIMYRDLCRRSADEADLVISPQLQEVAPGHFHRAREAIAAGENAARGMLPQIRKLLRKEGCDEHSKENSPNCGDPAC
ncbi:MAG: patatin-like phospholipase family protein [Firmicutes bacterium]|nr:patatin-like phospholipase family protein [Bacillota bacterium]